MKTCTNFWFINWERESQSLKCLLLAEGSKVEIFVVRNVSHTLTKRTSLTGSVTGILFSVFSCCIGYALVWKFPTKWPASLRKICHFCPYLWWHSNCWEIVSSATGVPLMGPGFKAFYFSCEIQMFSIL